FEVQGAPVQVEIAPLGDGRFAVKTSRFAISYRSEGARNPIDPRAGMKLCQSVAERVAKNEERVSEVLARAVSEVPGDQNKIREVRVESVLEPASHGAERFYKLS